MVGPFDMKHQKRDEGVSIAWVVAKNPAGKDTTNLYSEIKLKQGLEVGHSTEVVENDFEAMS